MSAKNIVIYVKTSYYGKIWSIEILESRRHNSVILGMKRRSSDVNNT